MKAKYFGNDNDDDDDITCEEFDDDIHHLDMILKL